MDFIIEHKIFVIPLIVILITQFIKVLKLTFKEGFHWHMIFDPGNFPSAHSAFVVSLVICVGYYSKDNSFSSEFAIAVCFAFITIYDAMRVRMQIGIQAKFLNELVGELKIGGNKKFPHLNEHVGHYASEVVGGILIGLMLSFWLIGVFSAW